jgi:hypothetical protein
VRATFICYDTGVGVKEFIHHMQFERNGATNSPKRGGVSQKEGETLPPFE